MVMPGAQGLRRDALEIGDVIAGGERLLLFEQLGESGASVIWSARGSLTFDDSPWRKQLAGIAGVFVYDACRHRFTTLKPRARIEIIALPASMQLRFTGCATGFTADRGRHFSAA